MICFAAKGVCVMVGSYHKKMSNHPFLVPRIASDHTARYIAYLHTFETVLASTLAPSGQSKNQRKLTGSGATQHITIATT